MSNVRVSFTSTTSSQGTTVASEHHLDCGGERKSNHHHNSKQAFKLDDVDGTPFLDEARPFGDSVDPDETEEEEGMCTKMDAHPQQAYHQNTWIC